MYDINFLRTLENELENTLGGKVLVLKSVDYIKGWRILSKKEIKNKIKERICINSNFYIVYDESDLIYKEMIDVLNILKEDYKELLDDEKISLVKIKDFDNILQKITSYEVKTIVSK